MYKLGEDILTMKEDFLMVHLQYCCSHCREFIISGHRWTCPACKNFNLCESCHEAELLREEKDRHPIIMKEAHSLERVKVDPEPPRETRDADENMESEFFDTRQAFLSLCQGNHYQYDTLRRAKHSSMMVLYHLHNPSAPAFVSTCNACAAEIEAGSGFRCTQCADFDLCAPCHARVPHPHPLVSHASQPDSREQSAKGRQQRMLEMRKMLDLLVHCSTCNQPKCPIPKCHLVKSVFFHGKNCKVRMSGGCLMCKRMWSLMQFHARSCQDNHCKVPRCGDLRSHVQRAQRQSESRRRKAVQEMMRRQQTGMAGNDSD